MLNVEAGARFDGSALIGLDASRPGTYYYDPVRSWWVRELEPEEQLTARDPQTVVGRNDVVLDLSVFNGCTSLWEVVIPAGVAELQGTLEQSGITLVNASDYAASYAQARGLPFRRLETPSA